MNRYYEEPPKRRAYKKRRGFHPIRSLRRLLAIVLVVALLLCVGLYFLPASMFAVDPATDLSVTQGLPSEPYNVLVLGVDVLNDGICRSDTMIVASIERGNVKLMSLERDVLVDIDGHGTQKLNAAYAYGGPELAMKKVNELYGLNITRYAVVDFTCLVKMVDAIGGINVDITQDEMKHINKNVLLSRKVFEPLGYTAKELTVYGENTHLDGLQALGYARIRKLDSDLKRMQRQRITIRAMLNKLRSGLFLVWRDVAFLKAGLSGIETNLSLPELISLGEKVLLAEDMSELRLPVDGSFIDDGSAYTITDAQANRDRVYQFLYGAQ